jgi:hypothetical protein
LSPGLAEVIKLAQSHVADETIVAFIQNSGQPYNPSANEVLYLYDLGVSDKVVAALFKKAAAPAAAPSSPAPAPAAPDASLAAAPYDMMQPPAAPMAPPPPEAVAEPPPLENPQDSYFYDSLAPYGSWVQVVDIGWCWQPMVSSVDAAWMPYRNRGHWVLTDDGWYWASDYKWGWATFHYGRWSHDPAFGWVWSPGSVWAPAWVAWRDSDTYAGWAPLPPNVLFQPDVGLVAGGGLAGLDESFGLSASWFTFVTYDHFVAPRVSGFAVPASQAQGLFKSTKPINNYSVHGRKVVNSGVSSDRVAAATKTPVTKFSLDVALSPETSGGRVGLGLAVFRPDLSASGARVSASAPAQPVRINTATPERADSSSQAAPFRSGVNSGNFRSSPKSINPPADVSAPPGGRSLSSGNYDPGRAPRLSGSASAPGYAPGAPAQRGYNSVPPAAPAFPGPQHIAPGYSTPQRPQPAYGAPAANSPAPPAPNETRGGGGGADVYPSYPNQGVGSAPFGATTAPSRPSTGR